MGFRLVRTDEQLTGNLANGTPASSDDARWDVLPVVNGRVRLQEKTFFRFSAGRVITRPNFSDLNPVVNLQSPTSTGGSRGTGSGGNRNLKSVRSDNFDLSLEHYFAKGSYASFTPFHRSIDGYVQSFASVENIGGTEYIVTRPRNADKGNLGGFEVTYQHFPEFPMDALKGFGRQTNLTYMEGRQKAPDPTSIANPPPIVSQRFAQVSKYACNIIAMYERFGFSARLAYNQRGNYVDSFNGPNSPTSGIRTIRVKATDRMDFSP